MFPLTAIHGCWFWRPAEAGGHLLTLAGMRAASTVRQLMQEAMTSTGGEITVVSLEEKQAACSALPPLPWPPVKRLLPPSPLPWTSAKSGQGTPDISLHFQSRPATTPTPESQAITAAGWAVPQSAVTVQQSITLRHFTLQPQKGVPTLMLSALFVWTEPRGEAPLDGWRHTGLRERWKGATLWQQTLKGVQPGQSWGWTFLAELLAIHGTLVGSSAGLLTSAAACRCVM